MISLFKAIPFGIFLTVMVSLFIGSGGSQGDVLNVHLYHPELFGESFRLYWSWPLFVCGTVLAWVILLMMGD